MERADGGGQEDDKGKKEEEDGEEEEKERERARWFPAIGTKGVACFSKVGVKSAKFAVPGTKFGGEEDNNP